MEGLGIVENFLRTDCWDIEVESRVKYVCEKICVSLRGREDAHSKNCASSKKLVK
jgi:hypothetical protein